MLALVGCGRVAFDELAPPAVDAPGDPSLRLHFSFDASDLLADSSGYRHDGTCTSCPLAVGGRVGSGAAAFTPGQCIHVADALDLRPDAFTLSAWATAAGKQNGSVFWRAYNGATSQNDAFGIGFSLTQDAYLINAAGAGVTNPPTPVGWHHYAASFDGANLTSYFDGVMVGGPASGGALYGNDELTMGCQIDFGGEVYLLAGSIDDVRFYDRALSASEISDLYNI